MLRRWIPGACTMAVPRVRQRSVRDAAARVTESRTATAAKPVNRRMSIKPPSMVRGALRARTLIIGDSIAGWDRSQARSSVQLVRLPGDSGMNRSSYKGYAARMSRLRKSSHDCGSRAEMNR